MGTFLFESPVFGPVNSRRLGVSLGINLLPADGKVCSFNCLYCECGLNEERRSKAQQLPTRQEVKEALAAKLAQMHQAQEPLNVITFAGNGEPTLHPEFASIVEDVVVLRNRYFPEVKISVLSNSAHLHKGEVASALSHIDNNILKIDSAISSTFNIINQPVAGITLEKVVKGLEGFGGDIIIQTLFCKGLHNGESFDNTTPTEIEALISVYEKIKPKRIMIYSLSRDTPVETLEKVDKESLEIIATKLRTCGFNVEVA